VYKRLAAKMVICSFYQYYKPSKFRHPNY
jgi:hypothetical protein